MSQELGQMPVEEFVRANILHHWQIAPLADCKLLSTHHRQEHIQNVKKEVCVGGGGADTHMLTHDR